MDEKKYLAIGPKQVSDLLNDQTVTSADYNQIKLLYDGKVVHFMGFDFILSNRLQTSGSDRLCLAYTQPAVVLGIGEDVKTKISERADKSYATQVYLCMGIGAVRRLRRPLSKSARVRTMRLVMLIVLEVTKWNMTRVHEAWDARLS